MQNIHTPRPQQGLTLIELMVALVVGMLVTLAATSGAVFFEASRRSSIANSGALENGIAVSFQIQSAVQSAGLWAVNAPCSKIWKYNYTTSAWESSSDVSASAFMGTPVELTAGSTAATSSDSITIRAMSSLIGAPITLTTAANGAVLSPTTVSGFAVGDQVLVAPPSGNTSECFLGEVTEVNSSSTNIQARPSVNGTQVNALPSSYNYPAQSQVFNMGQLRNTLFRVTNTFNSKDLDVFETVNLKTDADADTDRNNSTTVLAENIVMLRAQYGISSSATSLAIDSWVNPGNTNAVANRIRAIRIAVVARSQQPNLRPEHKDSSGNCTTTTANPAIPWTIDTSKDDTPRNIDLDLGTKTARKCYEFRVTNIVIPLKNHLFSGGGV